MVVVVEVVAALASQTGDTPQPSLLAEGMHTPAWWGLVEAGVVSQR